MQIPLGTIRAVVTDDDGLPVPFPIVSILNGRNNEMVGSVIGNAEGIEYETKADKYVYLKVRKKDSNPPFADYRQIETGNRHKARHCRPTIRGVIIP